MNFLKRFFSKPDPIPASIWMPETDVELLNKGICPDCGSTSRTSNGSRTIECGGCGSAFGVIPATPPFISASHIGFNRDKRKELQVK